MSSQSIHEHIHTYVHVCIHTQCTVCTMLHKCVTIIYLHTCSEGLHIDKVHLVPKEDGIVERVHTAEKQVVGIDQIITDLRILTCNHYTNVRMYICNVYSYTVHTYICVSAYLHIFTYCMHICVFSSNITVCFVCTYVFMYNTYTYTSCYCCTHTPDVHSD